MSDKRARLAYATDRKTAPVFIPPSPEAPTAAYVVRVPLRTGQTFSTFWMADAHMDSPECSRKLLKRHLDEALALNAMVFDVGDFMDVIGGRSDPRGSKSVIRAEDATGHYLDSVIDHAADFLHPYRNILAVIGTGNHEAGVYKKLETDLTRRLVDKLNAVRDPSRPPIQRANYKYWVVFQIGDASRNAWFSTKVVAYHGTGGGGEMTKGTLSVVRRMAVFAGADYIVQGHIHEKWNMDVVQESLHPTTYEPQFKPREAVQLGSYKVDWQLDGAATWHMQRAGGVPKPLGGKFIEWQLAKTNKPKPISSVRTPHVDYDDL